MTRLYNNISWILNNDWLIVLIFVLVWISIIFRFLKNNLKKKYYSTTWLELNKQNNEEIIFYYQKRYILDLLNVLLSWIIIIWYLYTIHVNFAFLSVAIGALILIIQPYIQSFISYIFLTTRFKIGDTIKINDFMWDIIFIKPLFTGITGRNDLWEHTGEIHIAPNNIFTSNVVSRLDIKLNNIRKNIITFVYDNQTFDLWYTQLLVELRDFLHDLLPVRSIEECGPFKSYIGHKFKLSSKYEWKDLKISIWYLDSYADARDSMEQITWFIENLKAKK